MRILRCVTVLAAAVIATSDAAQAIITPTMTTTGAYDPASAGQPNNVDFNAAGIPLTAGTGNGATAPVGTFNALMATAFTAGRGGVIDFESISTGSPFSGLNASYAAGSKSLAISTSSQIETSTGVAVEDGSPTSGTQYAESEGATPFTFTFNAITGASVGETGVLAAGITLLSGNNTPSTPFAYGTVTVTGKFSDNTTFAASRTIGELKGAGDTFYSVVAPANLTISSLTLSATNGSLLLPEFDDLAFVTSAVPEPSTLLLFGVGIPALLTGRRCRRSQ